MNACIDCKHCYIRVLGKFDYHYCINPAVLKASTSVNLVTGEATIRNYDIECNRQRSDAGSCKTVGRLFSIVEAPIVEKIETGFWLWKKTVTVAHDPRYHNDLPPGVSGGSSMEY